MIPRWKLFGILPFLLVATTCGNARTGTPGVTDDTIRVGMTMDLTGPVAFLGQEMSAGAKLYFQYVNDQGGVHGRKIELIVEDDGYQPPRTVAAYRKLIDRDQVFCLASLGTAPTMALRPIVERELVPIVPALTFASVIYSPPSRYVFGLDPSYRMTSWILLEYAVNELKATEARIGVIYQDDDLGNDGLVGLREAAAHYGLTIVAEEGHKRGAIDFASKVLNVKKAGATHVVLWTLLRESAAILKEAKKLGWAPEFLAWYGVADDRIVELASDAAENLHVLSPFDFESEHPQIREYMEVRERYDPEHRLGTYHGFGYAAAQILIEALERAGRDLNREKLVEALETFDRWDDNLYGHPFTYTPGVRGGTAAKTFFTKADLARGKLVRVTEDAVFQMPDL